MNTPMRRAMLTVSLAPVAWAIATLSAVPRGCPAIHWAGSRNSLARDPLVLLGTITLPLLTPVSRHSLLEPLGVIEWNRLGWNESFQSGVNFRDSLALVGLFAITTSIAAFAGLQWKPRLLGADVPHRRIRLPDTHDFALDEPPRHGLGPLGLTRLLDHPAGRGPRQPTLVLLLHGHGHVRIPAAGPLPGRRLVDGRAGRRIHAAARVLRSSAFSWRSRWFRDALEQRAHHAPGMHPGGRHHHPCLRSLERRPASAT